MITAIVRFPLPKGMTLEDAKTLVWTLAMPRVID